MGKNIFSNDVCFIKMAFSLAFSMGFYCCLFWKNIVCLFMFILYFLVKYEDRGSRRERNRSLPEVQKGRGYDRSRSRSPRDNRSDRGLNQHRQHQERRQFSPGRRVRERSGSGHSSGHSLYSDHQHQEQQIAITVENEGGAPSNIPLKVYQKKVSIVYSINCIFLKTLKTRFLKKN